MKERGGTIIAISAERFEMMRDREGAREMGLVMLSDPDLAVTGQYGLADRCLDLPCAHPATFIVDAHGQLVWKRIGSDWRLRPSPDEVLAAFEHAVPPDGGAP